MKIFFLRHQVEGVLWQLPFSTAPTFGQIEHVEAVMRKKHGSEHPKTKEPFFLKVVELEVIEPGTPLFDLLAMPGEGKINVAHAGAVNVIAFGEVKNPE